LITIDESKLDEIAITIAINAKIKMENGSMIADSIIDTVKEELIKYSEI